MSLRTSCCDLPQNEQYEVFFQIRRTCSCALLPQIDRGTHTPRILNFPLPRRHKGQRTLCDMGMSKRRQPPRYTTTEFLAKDEEAAVFTGRRRRAAILRRHLFSGPQTLPSAPCLTPTTNLRSNLGGSRQPRRRYRIPWPPWPTCRNRAPAGARSPQSAGRYGGRRSH